MPKQVHFNSVEELLPHQGRMVLITDVLDWGEDWLCATVDHSKGSLFSDADGSVPAWAGIEYMAQTIGALIGIRAIQKGHPIRIGFLMGTQQYESAVSCFAKDTVVKVKVEEVYSDRTNLAVFDCQIFTDQVLATAQIKAIRPEDPKLVLGAN